MVDLIAILAVVLCALLGYIRGGLMAVLGLMALIVAYFASALVGPPLGAVIAAHSRCPAVTAYLMGRIAGGVLIYVLLMAPAVILARKMGRTERGKLRMWNRGIGAFFGVVWGACLALVLLFLADVATKVVPEATGRLADSARRSVLRRCVSSLNPADRFLVTDILRLLRAARQDPEVFQRLRAHEQFRQLQEHPAFKRVSEDRKLTEAIHSRDVAAILRNENLRRLLADKELRRRILSPEIRLALQEVLPEGAGSSTTGAVDESS